MSTNNQKKLSFSFEFFPPKNEELLDNLWSTIDDLESLEPSFVSVTYGAGGSTRQLTKSIIARILEKNSIKPAAHLTCVCATKEEIQEILKNYWDMGLRHIVALRGDPPGNSGQYTPHPGGYAYADNLVAGIKEIGDFEISVAAYPETHPSALSPQDDIDHLKRKLDAGANRAITQYFFEAETFMRFYDSVRKAGITAPIVPGIINIHNYEQIVRFSGMCKSSIPQWMHDKLSPLKGDEAATKSASVEISTEICKELIANGINDFHFYTMNRSDMTRKIVQEL